MVQDIYIASEVFSPEPDHVHSEAHYLASLFSRNSIPSRNDARRSGIKLFAMPASATPTHDAEILIPLASVLFSVFEGASR